MKIWITQTDLECLQEGEEVTIANKIDIEVGEIGRIVKGYRCIACGLEVPEIQDSKEGECPKSILHQFEEVTE